MHTRHLSPALIGKQVRIQDNGLDITGVLQDLAVTVDECLGGYEVTSIQVILDGHELRLTGWETCSIIAKKIEYNPPRKHRGTTPLEELRAPRTTPTAPLHGDEAAQKGPTS